MNRNALIFGSLLVAAGCGPQTEDELIPDSEVEAVQLEQQQSAITATEATTAAAPAPFHLRLAWGYLGGKRDARSWVNWTGGVSIDDGTATLEHLTYFDRRDEPVPSDDPRKVAWVSRTLPHFDGLIVKVVPTAQSHAVTFATPPLTRELSL